MRAGAFSTAPTAMPAPAHEQVRQARSATERFREFRTRRGSAEVLLRSSASYERRSYTSVRQTCKRSNRRRPCPLLHSPECLAGHLFLIAKPPAPRRFGLGPIGSYSERRARPTFEPCWLR